MIQFPVQDKPAGTEPNTVDSAAPKRKRLTPSLLAALKIIVIFATTFLVFWLGKNLIGDINSVPAAVRNAYPPSPMIRNGLLTPALILLTALVFAHLLVTYLFARKRGAITAPFQGSLYGFSFGVLWCFGFAEMIVVFRSDAAPQILSGVRDLITLSVFGTLSGLLFRPPKAGGTKRRESLLVALPVSFFFALGHGAQYYLTFPGLKQSIADPLVIAWLFATGAWIGVMYWLAGPVIENPVLRSLFFAFSVFFVDWFLYDFFFALFLNLPVVDLFIRCLFGAAGVFAGLLVYEALKRVSAKRAA